MKKKTTLELVEQSEKVSFYSISFAADRTTEFELFIREFEDEAILNKDYQRILTALKIILDKGALERSLRFTYRFGKNKVILFADFRRDSHYWEWWEENRTKIRG